MISPAVVGNFWTFCPNREIGPNYVVSFFSGIDPASFQMNRRREAAPAWSIVLVDVWMWTPYVMLICLAGPALDSGLHLRSCGGRPRLGWRRSAP